MPGAAAVVVVARRLAAALEYVSEGTAGAMRPTRNRALHLQCQLICSSSWVRAGGVQAVAGSCRIERALRASEPPRNRCLLAAVRPLSEGTK